MKIVIDCRHINSSGIGVYLKECLPFFFDTKNDFLLLGDINKLNSINVSSNTELIHCDIKPFSLNDTFLFPRSLLKKINYFDAFYSPYFNIPNGIKIPIYTTIHDIIFPDIPELTSKLGLSARMYFYKRSFHYSKKIFTVSNFSKSRIEYYSNKQKPIIVTSNSIKTSFLSNPIKTNRSVKKDYILFVGNIKKHKGLDCLLKAFNEAKKCGLKQSLFIVGAENGFRSKDKYFYDKLSSFQPDDVKFFNSVTDDDLSVLFREASLLVQPSLYEGFGIPPLEAMFFGTKALISDIPVFREVYNEFPVTFFKPDDPVDLKENILSILKNKEPPLIYLTNELINKYSYKKTSELILKEIIN